MVLGGYRHISFHGDRGTNIIVNLPLAPTGQCMCIAIEPIKISQRILFL